MSVRFRWKRECIWDCSKEPTGDEHSEHRRDGEHCTIQELGRRAGLRELLLSHGSSRSVAKLCPTLCDPMDCSTPGFPVPHCLPESAQTHVHWAGDAIQPSHPLSPSSPPAFNLSQHQGLFQWVGSSHQVAEALEHRLQHQPFQWIFRVIEVWAKPRGKRQEGPKTRIKVLPLYWRCISPGT